jgi:hypothetical protein
MKKKKKKRKKVKQNANGSFDAGPRLHGNILLKVAHRTQILKSPFSPATPSC